MRIEQIEIHNFRQFRSLRLKFPHAADQNDLHVIFARNRVGKTNILNALTWCLYNSEKHLGNQDTASEKLNNHVISELRSHLPEGGSALGEVRVNVQFNSDNNSEKINFQRVGKYNVTQEAVIPIDDKFSIMQFHDGEWNSIESEEETQSLVKKTVPEEIHDYIFFDGEHLDHYFRAKQFENIKNGIEELTQAKIVEKAASAFNNYITGVLTPVIAQSSVKDLAEAQQALDTIQSAIDSTQEDINTLKSQINQSDDDLSELDGIISGHVHVSEKTARLREVERLTEETKEEIEEKRKQLMIFARKYVQSFALYPAIKSLYQYIGEQDKNHKLPPRIDKFLLDSIEQHKHCLICDQDLGDHSISFIEQLKKELEVSSDTSALLNKSVSELRQHLSMISEYKVIRDKMMDEYKNLRQKQNKYLAEEQQLNTYLMNIPDSEAITKAIERKKEIKQTRDELVGKKGVEEAHLKDLDNQLVAQSKKLKALIEKNKQFEKINKQAEYCKKCRNILNEIRIELLQESRDEMAKETFDVFNKLLWKKDAFSKVEILEDYTFRLLDNYGQQTLGSCSAAERALLALSFTLALQKVSTHDSLLFIDTPLGRVDDENRANFIHTLCNIAKERQVILTFTPTEYDANVQRELYNQYSSFTELVNIDGETVTK